MLVCGATGFIGRNIAEYFARQENMDVTGVFHDCLPYENPGINWVQADLTRSEEVERVMLGVDIVVQAASVTSGAKDIVTRPFFI